MPPQLIKLFSLLLSFVLVSEQPGLARAAGQMDISGYFAQLHQSLTQDKFRPMHLRYLSYDTQANSFQLFLDKGDTVPEEKLQEEAQALFKYFLIGLSLPNEKFWVNLRPDSPENIIDDELAKTDLGRVLLEADLQLKKDTARATSPETAEGKEYWDKLYKKAAELFPANNVTIPTLTRPWIVPNEIIVRESETNAYIYKATLKVMLEEDYIKSQVTSHRSQVNLEQYSFNDQRLKELNEYATQLIRETILPKLTYAVNTAKRYAPLRQVYYSLIMAQWFKQRFGEPVSRLASPPVNPLTGKPANPYIKLIDSRDLTNLISKEPYDKQAYFKVYQRSFKEGEYNLKEPVHTPYGQSIRSYLSGGIEFGTNSSRGPSIIEAINIGRIAAKSNSPLYNRDYLIHCSTKGGPIQNSQNSVMTEIEILGQHTTSSAIENKEIEKILKEMKGRKAGIKTLKENLGRDKYDEVFNKLQVYNYVLRLKLLQELGVLKGTLLYPAIGNDFFPSYFADTFGINNRIGLGFDRPFRDFDFVTKIKLQLLALEDIAIKMGLPEEYREKAKSLTLLPLDIFKYSSYSPKILQAGSVDVLLIKGLTYWVGFHKSFPGIKPGEVSKKILRQDIADLIQKIAKELLKKGGFIVIADKDDLWLTDFITQQLGYRDFLSQLEYEEIRKVLLDTEDRDSYETQFGEANVILGNVPLRILQKPVSSSAVIEAGGTHNFLVQGIVAYNTYQPRVIGRRPEENKTVSSAMGESEEITVKRNDQLSPEEKRRLRFVEGELRYTLLLRGKESIPIGRLNWSYDSDRNQIDDISIKITQPEDRGKGYGMKLWRGTGLLGLLDKERPGKVVVDGIAETGQAQGFWRKILTYEKETWPEEPIKITLKVGESKKEISLSQLQKDDVMIRFVLEVPVSASSAVREGVRDLGGVDFMQLPIVSQPEITLPPKIGGSSPLINIPGLNLDEEWMQIQNMLRAGIRPSSERLREYALASSSLEPEDYLQQGDKLLGCIAGVLRLEEERVLPMEAILREILVLLESDKPAEELQAALSKITVLPKEYTPKK